MNLHYITAVLAAHPAITAWVVATLLAVYRSRTAAQWIALGESFPRVQGIFKLARALGFEPSKVLEGAMQTITGRRVADPRDAIIATHLATIARLEAEHTPRDIPGAP